MKGSINDQSTYKQEKQKMSTKTGSQKGKGKGDYGQSGLEIDKLGLREYIYRIKPYSTNTKRISREYYEQLCDNIFNISNEMTHSFKVREEKLEQFSIIEKQFVI